jgi:hypothetical protein
MKANRIILIMICLASVSGCSTKTLHFNRPLSYKNIQELIDISPRISLISADRKFARTDPDSVELYYYNFTFFDTPINVKNWKHHFMVGPESSPEW